MIRDMIRLCLSRYDNRSGDHDSHILQMFILTHNRYFFNSVSDPFLPDHRRCAFFEVRKGRDNITQILRSEGKGKTPGLPAINIRPVPGFSPSLWQR